MEKKTIAQVQAVQLGNRLGEEEKQKVNYKDKDVLLNSFGASGTSIIGGFIEDDYMSELSGQHGMQIYEEMRRSDAQVRATLLAISLPIRSTKWFLDPYKDEDGETDDEAWEIATFVENCLFKWMETTWSHFLEEALTNTAFGFSLFERVYMERDGQIVLRKLGFRKQTTIFKWETEDGKPGVTQLLPEPMVDGPNKGLQQVSIPASKLLLFSYQREGDNYAGVSTLRSAYKHWYIKDRLYKFDAVRHERQSVGIPMITVPGNATPEMKAEAKAIVMNIRSTEQTGIVLPSSEWKFEFADTKAGNSTNLYESIKHHNREIAKNILAQFLELGDSASGSRALSEDQSDLFLLSLTALSQDFSDVVNRFLIPELVALNYDTHKLPTLKYNKIGAADLEKFATTIASLTGASIINTDENIEDFVRDMFNLPARQQDETAVDDEGIEDEGLDQDLDDQGGDAPDDGEPGASLDDLEAELASLAAFEDDLEFRACLSEYLDEADAQIASFAAKRGPLSEEHKKAISEALKKKGGASLLNTRKQLQTRISDSSDSIEKAQEDFKAQTAGLKNDIDALRTLKDNIPSGKEGTAQRKELAAKVKELSTKIKAMRKDRDAVIAPLKAIRTRDIKTRRQVLAIIKERKVQVQAKIKAIRAELEAGRMSLKEAIEPMKADVKQNTLAMKQMRKAIKELPKGDPRREALTDMIEGLQEENTMIREEQGNMRKDYGDKREAGKQAIKAEKEQSGLYHDHDHGLEIDEEYLSISAKFNNKVITKLQNELSPEDRERAKQGGFRFNDYEDVSPRPLTFAEKKVNFTGMKKSMAKFEEILDKKMDDITKKQKDDILKQVKKAVESNDIEAIGKIEAKYGSELSAAITEVQKEMFEVGKKSAATEMGVSIPPTKPEVKGAMRVQADAAVDEITSRAQNVAKNTASQVIAKQAGQISATNASAVIAEVGAALDAIYTKQKSAVRTLGVTGSVNMGRSTIFERFPEQVYGFQFSAILDDRTTDTCRSLDGRIVKPGSLEYYNYSPPRHYNCRSIWVEILEKESFKPDITGIPSSIPAGAGLDNFRDLKAPVILKDSPAVKIVQQELDDVKQKLAEIKDSGKYQNRQEGYEKRISELQRSLSFAEDADLVLLAQEILEVKEGGDN